VEAIHRGGDVGGDDRNNTTLDTKGFLPISVLRVTCSVPTLYDWFYLPEFTARRH